VIASFKATTFVAFLESCYRHARRGIHWTSHERLISVFRFPGDDRMISISDKLIYMTYFRFSNRIFCAANSFDFPRKPRVPLGRACASGLLGFGESLKPLQGILRESVSMHIRSSFLRDVDRCDRFRGNLAKISFPSCADDGAGFCSTGINPHELVK
jgi:hypothetical protein